MANSATAFGRTSVEAILYSIREIGRRAGATTDWISRWRVHISDERVTLFPGPDSDACIIFPFEFSKPSRFANLRMQPATHYHWMRNPSAEVSEMVPDFIVLFEDRSTDGVALFEATETNTVQCHADVLTSALWTLSRMEELTPLWLDAHERFPADASAAYRANCLDRPIVDEYALAFREALLYLFPRWEPAPQHLRVKLSHDMDRTGIPRRLGVTLAHLYPRHMFEAFARDVLSAAGVGLPAYLQAIMRIADISHARGLDSAIYWKASRVESEMDWVYDVSHPTIRSVIQRLSDNGFEIGLHPAYTTFGSQERLEDEVANLRRVVGERPIGGRYHYLRWNPSAWRAWEDAGLAYDSTVGYADRIGFRAGTAVPYHPFSLEENRELSVLEIPLVVMDCTPVTYMHMTNAQTVDSIAMLIRRCALTGGVFTLLWHNVSAIEPPYAALYPRLLNLLPTNEAYDWRSDREIQPLPRTVGETAHA
jgi:hypothetical protein